MAYLVTALPLLLFLALFRLVYAKARLSVTALAALALVGATTAVGCYYLEAALWGWTGLRTEPGPEGRSSLMAMLMFAAPLEEGSKVLSVWPLHKLHRLKHRADGLLAATAVATGFAIAESILYLQSTSAELPGLRSALGSLAHVCFAALWGYVLGQRSKLHLLSMTWLLSMIFHGLFDHIVFGRGVGTLVVGVLLSLALLGLCGLIIRDVFHEEDEMLQVSQAPRLQDLTLKDLTQALRRRDQPLMLHWILFGALVNTGVVLACLAAGVYFGHQLGVDFAAADEGDMRSNGPLVLLGAAVTAAFPIAGYLIARASGTRSVLEPAMGAAAAIAVVVTLLSMAAPIAVVFALAVAPLAFGLACAGAWFGLAR